MLGRDKILKAIEAHFEVFVIWKWKVYKQGAPGICLLIDFKVNIKPTPPSTTPILHHPPILPLPHLRQSQENITNHNHHEILLNKSVKIFHSKSCLNLKKLMQHRQFCLQQIFLFLVCFVHSKVTTVRYAQLNIPRAITENCTVSYGHIQHYYHTTWSSMPKLQLFKHLTMVASVYIISRNPGKMKHQFIKFYCY